MSSELKCILCDTDLLSCYIESADNIDIDIFDNDCFSFTMFNGIRKPIYNDLSIFMYSDLLPYTYNDLITKILF